MSLLNYLPSLRASRVPPVAVADDESFQILRITARSDHPVRNSAGELIFGDHVLWGHDNTTNDDKGSSAPNVFAYNFNSPLASNSLLNIALKVVNPDVVGADYRLCGTLDGLKVFESDIFTIRSTNEATVVVHVVEPHSSPNPLVFNEDITWVMEQQKSERKLGCADETRLELYWVSTNLHEIFLTGLSGIPVDFLRAVFPSRNPEFKFGIQMIDWSQTTRQVFSNYSKRYDTVAGAPRFGVSGQGGRFNYSYYIRPWQPGGAWGSMQPIVNCYDQAAMVQVAGSLGGFRPSWLYQEPNGYINTTYLVGIPQPCNNPFFNQTNPPLPAYINVNDQRRTSFGRHVFNGYFNQFRRYDPQERIYDACGGPQAGFQDPTGYVRTTIDTTTNLYQVFRRQPGTVANIIQYLGVTGTLLAPPRLGESAMSANVKKLLQRCSVNNAKPYSQVCWDDVGTWVKVIFGNGCKVAYQSNDIGNGMAEGLWHLTGVGGVDGDVVVRVRAETRVGGDGKLDLQSSSEAAYDNFVFTLKDIELHLGSDDEGLEKLWVPAPFDDYAQYAIQYAPSVPEGRILLVSGNFMINITGGSSSAALEPVARQLLAHTTLDKPSSLHIPSVILSSYDIPASSKSNLKETVKGVGSSFDFECEMDDLIAAASADVEEHGLLLSKCRITPNEANTRSTVQFTFVTRALGTHVVNLRFQQARTMSTSVRTIQVMVTDA